jgi:hypothetical protein
MAAALYTRHGDIPLTITREELLPGMDFWVMEPHGRFCEGRDSGGRRILHRLPCHAGRDLGEVWTRVAEDLQTLAVIQ